MSSGRSTVYFDFLDPLSYLLALELDALDDGVITALAWHPFELRPPPTPLTTVDDPSLADRWGRARELASDRDVSFSPPRLVPWTRKAHELVIHAAEHERADAVRRRIFRAHLLEEEDIGRVDVLVRLAVEEGLDRTETKAVLDVDSHEAAVADLRHRAEERGVTDTPTVEHEGTRLEGFHNRDALGTLLGT